MKGIFSRSELFEKGISPVYGEERIEINFLIQDLIWKELGQLVRFVLVDHPTRGRIILLSTDTKLSAMEIIKLYGLRFKIEVSFKEAVHTIGTFKYHLWMKDLKKIQTRQTD